MPLSQIRAVEIGGLPSGAYCARLLADFGAEVFRVEPPGGDPLRAMPPFVDGGAGRESGWFAYLNYNKKSVALDPASGEGRARLDVLLRHADVLIDSLEPAQRAAAGIDHDALRQRYPGLIVADVSWFGRSGPYAGYRCTDAVCRAMAGLVQLVGPREGPPLALPDYQAAIAGGLSTVIPVLAALLARLRGAAGRRLEVSVLEANITLAEYQMIEAWSGGTIYERWGMNRFAPTYPLGIYPCKSGWLGVTIVTPAQWRAFCELLGMDELARHPDYVMGTERLPRADELEARFVPVLAQRTAEEWFRLGLELRLPFAIVPSMAEALTLPAFRERRAIVPVQLGSAVVEAPGAPLTLTLTPPRFGGKVPAPGEHDGEVERLATAAPRAANADVAAGAAGALPLEGVRIVDLSMGWAGPVATRNLGDLGADVIKVEACQYPDWWRGVDNRPAVIEQMLYEKSNRFNIMNRNKRAITLDLTTEEGVRLVKELVRGADAVIENYSAGVLAKMGLDYARLREVNPSLVMVSMAAFGSTGAWRECRAYGSTLEQGSGLPSVSGLEDGPPMMNHLAFGDAVGGLNAASAMLVALTHRQRTGMGQHVDLSQVQCMLPYTAAWMIEQSANGRLGPRRGNRHPVHAPHGCFRCAGEDSWVFIAVTDDAAWQALCRTIGRDDLAQDAALAGATGRQARETEIEAAIGAWTRTRTAPQIQAMLQAAGVAAGAVTVPIDLLEDPHLQARGFWQFVDRDFVGRHPQPSAPYREGAAPFAVRRPAATLGQHNEEILRDVLGLSAAQIAELAARGVIGTKALPASQRKARAAAG